MKPTVISNATASASAGNGAPTSTSSNGITIPINHEYGGAPQQQHHQQHPQYQQQQAYSPQQQQQQQHPQPQQQQGFSAGSPSNTRQYPAHFQQGFGFEPDMDDMFPRSSRLGRLHHDPFAGFTARKRCGNDPHSAAADGFSHYFDDDPDFGFPQFGSLGRRRAGAGANANSGGVDPHTGLPTHAADHDFFNRLPSEFRQYIPEGFGTTRRSNNVPAAAAQHQAPPPQTQYYQQQPQPHQQQHFAQPSNTPPKHNGGVNVGVGIPPQSPTKKLCDAAIQTEDPATVLERSEVDGHHMQPPMPQQQQQDYLNQHGLRNTVDMGVKSNPEMTQEHRSHSAPPQEQLQQQQQQQHQPSASSQFSTQTSPPNPAHQQSPLYQKVYYPPQQQAHPQQKQKSPPLTPQTPGGTYIRTIPIFVEGRSEPIINSHKEIPNQNGTGGGVSATASARHAPPQQQQYQQEQPHQQQQQYYQSQAPHPQQQNRPTPLNTQQQQQPGAANDSAVPPQTPHTMDSINKIQDIQRDVLDLMSKVENFAGARKGKDYAYLDEMLTRNLLKLDTIDTNGKDSIRLARKEAIKCIQASINVLEAKAEENDRARLAQAAAGEPTAEPQQTSADEGEVTKETAAVAANTDAQVVEEQQPVDATQIQEPIPLPPPEGMQIDAAEVTNGNRVSPAKEMQAVLVLPAAESTESKME